MGDNWFPFLFGFLFSGLSLTIAGLIHKAHNALEPLANYRRTMANIKALLKHKREKIRQLQKKRNKLARRYHNLQEQYMRKDNFYRKKAEQSKDLVYQWEEAVKKHEIDKNFGTEKGKQLFKIGERLGRRNQKKDLKSRKWVPVKIGVGMLLLFFLVWFLIGCKSYSPESINVACIYDNSISMSGQPCKKEWVIDKYLTWLKMNKNESSKFIVVIVGEAENDAEIIRLQHCPPSPDPKRKAECINGALKEVNNELNRVLDSKLGGSDIAGAIWVALREFRQVSGVLKVFICSDGREVWKNKINFEKIILNSQSFAEVLKQRGIYPFNLQVNEMKWEWCGVHMNPSNPLSPKNWDANKQQKIEDAWEGILEGIILEGNCNNKN